MENVSDDFPQQRKLQNLPPNFAGSSPPISPKTSATSLWKSLVLTNVRNFVPPACPGPEMAAPTLWAPCSFFQLLSAGICKPWFPNRGSRFVTKQRLNGGFKKRLKRG